jgi:hypothetical protein
MYVGSSYSGVSSMCTVASSSMQMGCVEGRRTNLAHVCASLCNKAYSKYLSTHVLASWRGAVSVGCGVLSMCTCIARRRRSSSMLMCHQADSGSIICADASRCERRLICVSAACSLSLARSGPPSVARQAQRPSETQLAWSRISRKRRNEIHT